MVPARITPPASASRLYCMPGDNLDYLHSVFRIDPDGSALIWLSSIRIGNAVSPGPRCKIIDQNNQQT
jgi:hypothetical protein